MSGRKRAAGKLAPVGVAIAAAILAAGCSSPDSNADSGEAELPAMLEISDLKTFALPLDAYKLIGDQDTQIDRARNRLLVECLDRFGFELTVPKLEADVLGQNEQRYGIHDPDRAAQYGYREPEVDEQGGSREPDLSPEAQSIVNGEGQNIVGGQAVPEGGCLQEAVRKISDGVPGSVDPEIVYTLEGDAQKRTEQDSRVRKVFADWSACMKKSGYSYTAPMDANNDPLWSKPKITEEEIAVATADVTCKKESNLVNVWATVEAAYQKRTIEKNKQSLDKVAEYNEKQLTNAAKINQA